MIGTLLGLLSGYYGGWIDTFAELARQHRRRVPVLRADHRARLRARLRARATSTSRSRSSAGSRTRGSSAARCWSRSGATTCSRRKSGGLSDFRILFRHLLPNVITQAVVFAMSDIVLDILAIVTLGYLGLGVQPPTPDWGTMIAERADVPDHALGAVDVPGDRRRDHRARAVAARRRARRPAEAGVTRAAAPRARPAGRVPARARRRCARSTARRSTSSRARRSGSSASRARARRWRCARSSGCCRAAARIAGGTIEIDGVDVTAAERGPAARAARHDRCR